MALEDEVRKASQRFYAALNSTINGDSAPMRRSGRTARTPLAMHPFGGRWSDGMRWGLLGAGRPIDL